MLDLYVFSPVLLGALAERFGWANVLTFSAIFSLDDRARVLVLPETKGKALEETAAL